MSLESQITQIYDITTKREAGTVVLNDVSFSPYRRRSNRKEAFFP